MVVRTALPLLALFLSGIPAHAVSLYGRVEDLAGAPLAGAFVELRGPDGPWYTWTDAAGAWRMSNLQIEGVGREATIGRVDRQGNLELESGRLGLRFEGRSLAGRLGTEMPNAVIGSRFAKLSAARVRSAVPDTLVVTWGYAWVERWVLATANQGWLGTVRIDTSTRRDSIDLAAAWYRPSTPGRYAYTLFDSSSLEQPSLVTTTTEAEVVRAEAYDSCRGTLMRLSVDRLSLEDSVRSDSSWAVDSLGWTMNLANRFQNPAFGRDTVAFLAGAPRHVRLVGGGYSTTIANGREALLVVPGWGVVFARYRGSVMSGILARRRTVRLRSVDGVPLDQAELERLWNALQ